MRLRGSGANPRPLRGPTKVCAGEDRDEAGDFALSTLSELGSRGLPRRDPLSFGHQRHSAKAFR